MYLKSKKPVVSVLIPVFNGAQFLEETIASIQKSTYKRFEIILVDDGSTDNSERKCRALARRYANVRFYGFHQNGGMTRSLNYGVQKAKGRYIARINQDDLMVDSRLEHQVAFLEANPKVVAVGGYVRLFTKDNPDYDRITFPLTDAEIKKAWLYLSPFADPAVMYRKSAYRKTSGYSQEMWPADDVQMWYQLGKLGKLANLPHVLTRVRWHAGAGSIKSHRIQMRKTWEVHQWARQHVGTPTVFTWFFWLAEWVAGVVFPPSLNWGVYRLIRKLQGIRLRFVERVIELRYAVVKL